MYRVHHLRSIVLLILFLFIWVLPGGNKIAAQDLPLVYEGERLPKLPGVGNGCNFHTWTKINNTGHLIGTVTDNCGRTRRAYMYVNESVMELAISDRHRMLKAYDLNDQGQVIGHANFPDEPYDRRLDAIWENGTLTPIEANTERTATSVIAINNNGMVVGRETRYREDCRYGDSSCAIAAYPFVYSEGSYAALEDAPLFTPIDVNDHGTMAGWQQVGTRHVSMGGIVPVKQAAIYKNGGVELLPQRGVESEAILINNGGMTVGRYLPSYDGFMWLYYVMDPDGLIQDLPQLPGTNFNMAESTIYDFGVGVVDLNDHGHVVGVARLLIDEIKNPTWDPTWDWLRETQTCWIWDSENGIRFLDDMAISPHPVKRVMGINNKAEILASSPTGWYFWAPLMLTPCDECIGVKKIEPVQAVYNAPLVAMKPMIARVTFLNSFPEEKEVTVETVYQGEWGLPYLSFRNTLNLPTGRSKHFLPCTNGSDPPCTLEKTEFLMPITNSSFKVTVDPDNEILPPAGPLDQIRSKKIDLDVELIRPLKLLFLALGVDGICGLTMPPQNPLSPPAVMTEYLEQTRAYLSSVFPAPLTPEYKLAPNAPTLSLYSLSPFCRSHVRLLIKTLERVARTSKVDRVVGLLPYETLPKEETSHFWEILGEGGVLGETRGDNARAVLVTPVEGRKPAPPAVLAHEIGHTYGLPVSPIWKNEEYNNYSENDPS